MSPNNVPNHVARLNIANGAPIPAGTDGFITPVDKHQIELAVHAPNR